MFLTIFIVMALIFVAAIIYLDKWYKWRGQVMRDLRPDDVGKSFTVKIAGEEFRGGKK